MGNPTKATNLPLGVCFTEGLELAALTRKLFSGCPHSLTQNFLSELFPPNVLSHVHAGMLKILTSYVTRSMMDNTWPSALIVLRLTTTGQTKCFSKVVTLPPSTLAWWHASIQSE